MVWDLILLVGLWVLFLTGFFLFVRGYALGQKRADTLWEEAATETSHPHERRRYQRRYLPYPVKYASLEQADFQELTLTRDVGKGGIRFPAGHPLRQGSRLHLSINIPKKRLLSLFGEVVWQNPHAVAPSRFETGVKFVNLSTSNVMKIARHL